MRGRGETAGGAAHRAVFRLGALLPEKARQVTGDGCVGCIGQPHLGETGFAPLRHVVARHAGEKTFTEDAVDIFPKQLGFDSSAD